MNMNVPVKYNTYFYSNKVCRSCDNIIYDLKQYIEHLISLYCSSKQIRDIIRTSTKVYMFYTSGVCEDFIEPDLYKGPCIYVEVSTVVQDKKFDICISKSYIYCVQWNGEVFDIKDFTFYDEVYDSLDQYQVSIKKSVDLIYIKLYNSFEFNQFKNNVSPFIQEYIQDTVASSN